MTITDFSALALKLPLLDRGTLSQAWRDALHVAKPHSRAVSGRETPRDASASNLLSREASVPSRSPRLIMPVKLRAHESGSRTGCAVALPAPEQRARGAWVAGRLAEPSAQLRRTQAMRGASVVTLPNGERLCFIVAPTGSALRITVLCPAHLREEVRGALMRLRSLLARRDIIVDVATARSAS